MKKSLLLMLTTGLLLASCDVFNPPAASETGVTGTVVELDAAGADTLNPTLKSWTGGAGKVEGAVISPAGVPKVVASGTLNTNGTFSVSLPDTVEDAYLSDTSFDSVAPVLGDPAGLTCTGEIKVSDTGARTTALNFGVDAAKDGSIVPGEVSGSIDEGKKIVTTNVKFGLVVYTDRPLSLSGLQTCQGVQDGIKTTIKADVNVALAKGWTKLTLDLGNTRTITTNPASMTDTSTLTMKSGVLPAKWLFGGTMSPLSAGTLPQVPQLNLFR